MQLHACARTVRKPLLNLLLSIKKAPSFSVAVTAGSVTCCGKPSPAISSARSTCANVLRLVFCNFSCSPRCFHSHSHARSNADDYVSAHARAHMRGYVSESHLRPLLWLKRPLSRPLRGISPARVEMDGFYNAQAWSLRGYRAGSRNTQFKSRIMSAVHPQSNTV